MTERPPAFQFYPADFLADENVALMTNREVGCYIKLMCYCWRQGTIPKDIPSIARLCGEDDLSMSKMWPQISKCFRLNGERLYHKRLDIERQKQVAWRKKSSAGGKRSAASRAESLKGGSTLQSSSSSSSSPSGTDERDTNVSLFVDGQPPIDLAKFLFSKIQQNNPKAKPPNFQVWARHVDLMLRVDNRSVEDIRAVIEWAQDDDFWKGNILSTEKLRKQFDRLYMKLNANPLRGIVSDVTARTIRNLQNLDLD